MSITGGAPLPGSQGDFELPVVDNRTQNTLFSYEPTASA